MNIERTIVPGTLAVSYLVDDPTGELSWIIFTDDEGNELTPHEISDLYDTYVGYVQPIDEYDLFQDIMKGLATYYDIDWIIGEEV